MDTLRKVIAWAITAAWCMSIIYTAVDRTYNPPVSVHVLMVALVTALFAGPKILADPKRKDGDGD